MLTNDWHWQCGCHVYSCEGNSNVMIIGYAFDYFATVALQLMTFDRANSIDLKHWHKKWGLWGHIDLWILCKNHHFWTWIAFIWFRYSLSLSSFPGIQCTEINWILLWIFAAKYGCITNVWWFGQASIIRQKNTQQRCTKWFITNTAIAHKTTTFRTKSRHSTATSNDIICE